MQGGEETGPRPQGDYMGQPGFVSIVSGFQAHALTLTPGCLPVGG